MDGSVFTPKYGVECFGATRFQAGKAVNEDVFVIDRDPIPLVAIFDGAGNAEQAAERASRFFKTLITDPDASVGEMDTWAGWVRLMDSHLWGGPESTFVGAAVPDVNLGLIVGAYAGNSRAYLAGREGFQLLTTESSPARLGSGRVEARTFSVAFRPHDILLLMSDGAWAPFGNTAVLRKAIESAASRHFSEVPEAILGAATPPDGPPDDMTVVALRVKRF
jgi:serine/threonine protein phosphatase PrpC